MGNAQSAAEYTDWIKIPQECAPSLIVRKTNLHFRTFLSNFYIEPNFVNLPLAFSQKMRGVDAKFFADCLDSTSEITISNVYILLVLYKLGIYIRNFLKHPKFVWLFR